jgi:hypothetical protein
MPPGLQGIQMGVLPSVPWLGDCCYSGWWPNHSWLRRLGLLQDLQEFQEEASRGRHCLRLNPIWRPREWIKRTRYEFRGAFEILKLNFPFSVFQDLGKKTSPRKICQKATDCLPSLNYFLREIQWQKAVIYQIRTFLFAIISQVFLGFYREFCRDPIGTEELNLILPQMLKSHTCKALFSLIRLLNEN